MKKEYIRVLKMDHQGRGIGYLDGKIIFIQNALPEEMVLVKVTNVKKKFLEGISIEWQEKSPKRVRPLCPYYDKCGGCEIMHLSYDDQLKYKENKIIEIMNKYASVTVSKIKPIKESLPFYYRNKVTLQVNKRVGLYGKGSYELVPINKCIICAEVISKVISYLQKLDLTNINRITIRFSEATDEVMVIVDARGKINDLSFLKDVCTTLVVRKEKEEVIFGSGTIYETLGKFSFQISPSSFFQVNTKQAVKLYDQVLKYADLKGNETLLDLYCGTGTIGIYLSPYVKEVIGIEINADAVRDANINKEINNVKNAQFYCGDAGAVLSSLAIKPDIVVVDPPRAGLSEKARELLLKNKPKKIIYVSCNPMTLARDIASLVDYEVLEMTPVDLFPNTHHVECVAALQRKTLEK